VTALRRKPRLSARGTGEWLKTRLKRSRACSKSHRGSCRAREMSVGSAGLARLRMRRRTDTLSGNHHSQRAGPPGTREWQRVRGRGARWSVAQATARIELVGLGECFRGAGVETARACAAAVLAWWIRGRGRSIRISPRRRVTAEALVDEIRGLPIQPSPARAAIDFSRSGAVSTANRKRVPGACTEMHSASTLSRGSRRDGSPRGRRTMRSGAAEDRGLGSG